MSSSSGWEYKTGIALTGEVKSLENNDGKWYLVLERPVPTVHYIRLDFSDTVTYYGPVESVYRNRVELKDDPGFSLDMDGKTTFYTFPQDEHDGPLRFTMFDLKE